MTYSPEPNSIGNPLNGLDDRQEYYSTAMQLYKRAPMGFMGMRGKKDLELTDYHRRPDADALQDAMVKRFLFNYPMPYSPKRAPSGFMGMRGKKQLRNLNAFSPYSYDNKRAPSGFMGMRGKKESNDFYVPSSAVSGNDNVEAMSALENELELFERLENEQQLLNDIERYYGLEALEEIEKRAPSGFMGMRGKKMDGDGDNEFDKRAPNNGFFGMRGKKSFDTEDIDEDKRAPMGFQGTSMIRESC